MPTTLAHLDAAVVLETTTVEADLLNVVGLAQLSNLLAHSRGGVLKAAQVHRHRIRPIPHMTPSAAVSSCGVRRRSRPPSLCPFPRIPNLTTTPHRALHRFPVRLTMLAPLSRDSFRSFITVLADTRVWPLLSSMTCGRKTPTQLIALR